MTWAASSDSEGCVWLDGGSKIVVLARSVSLRAREPVSFDRAEAFVKLDAGGTLRVILTFHVDDGLLFGTRSDPIHQRVKELIDTPFDMKDWCQLPWSEMGAHT